jgi:hypothetical protein
MWAEFKEEKSEKEKRLNKKSRLFSAAYPFLAKNVEHNNM